jgi:predicted nucleotidyltransferase
MRWDSPAKMDFLQATHVKAMDDKIQIIETIKNELFALEIVTAAYVYGSLTKGNFRPDSDVDIALLCKPKMKLEPEEYFYLLGTLESKLGRLVQITYLTSANLVLAKEIIGYGERIFCRDRYFCECFEMQIFSMYADLNWQRREVLAAYGVHDE